MRKTKLAETRKQRQLFVRGTDFKVPYRATYPRDELILAHPPQALVIHTNMEEQAYGP